MQHAPNNTGVKAGMGVLCCTAACFQVSRGNASCLLTAMHVQGGPIALRLAKAAISGGMEMGIQAGLQFEQHCYAQVWLATLPAAVL